jgi:DNA mismatch repair protein MutS2
MTRLDDASGAAPRAAPRASRSANYGELYSSKVKSVSPSINVHFMDLEAALADVDKYLDDAFIAGLHEVSLIHGRGAGILRDGIRRMLKTHPHVTGFRRGEYNEGGDGVTICTLK